MSKKILWILTIALSLAILGLILLQLLWIDSAAKLKDKQFRQLVNNTLADVSQELEDYYTNTQMKSLITEEEEVEEIEMTWSIGSEEADKPAIIIDKSKPPKEEIIVLPNGKKNVERTVEVEGDSLLIISYSGKKLKDTIRIELSDEERKLKKLEESIKEQEMIVAKVMKKMLLEELSFSERIDKKVFEKILHGHLMDRGITLNYEYAILENNEDEVYITKDFYKEKADHYIYRSSLMSDNIYEENTYLYIYFPDQRKMIFSSLGFLGTSSVILTLVILVVFAFTIYVIYRQKRLSEIKNDFVNNMTHELKTPISTISLASQMLNDKSIDTQRKNYDNISRIIQTESKRLGYQVEKVLQMAVFDQGHLVLKKTQVDMHDLIMTVEQNFKLQMENNKGQLDLTLNAEEFQVYGDRVHLTNVISNLMDNAVKYSPELPHVQLNTNNTSQSFMFSIKDNGIGISKDNQRKIFDKFFRVSTGNVHDVQGFGLGLSYVKLIIEEHGGSISCSSELGKGTQFDVILPLHRENA